MAASTSTASKCLRSGILTKFRILTYVIETLTHVAIDMNNDFSISQSRTKFAGYLFQTFYCYIHEEERVQLSLIKDEIKLLRSVE